MIGGWVERSLHPFVMARVRPGMTGMGGTVFSDWARDWARDRAWDWWVVARGRLTLRSERSERLEGRDDRASHDVPASPFETALRASSG